MKKVLCFFLFCLLSLAVCGAEFDPAACPDLSVKIFQINERQAVLYVSTNTYAHKEMGFDGFEVRNQFYKNKQITNLTLEMSRGVSQKLRLAIPIETDKKHNNHIFKLSTRKSGWAAKINKEWAWQAEKVPKGILIFESYADSARKKQLRTLKVNMADNSAVLSSHPNKKFKVTWKRNRVTIHGLSGDNNDTLFMESYVRKIDVGADSGKKYFAGMIWSEYYNDDKGITVLRYCTGSLWGIFPRYEKFYLTQIE